jgi:flagellar basal-body rod protein FlgF
MPYGLYISAEGAHAQSKRIEAIANNLANVDTVGFKRDLAVFQARYAEAIDQGLVPADTSGLDNQGGGVVVQRTVTDFSPGPLKRTGIPTDVAIRGDGFFAVQKDDQIYLTRAGNFTIDERGQLLTQQGHAVLSSSGTPIVIDPANGPWQVSPSGAIQQAGISQNLALVMPQSLGDLVKVGGNLFRSLAETQPIDTAKRSVAGNYLELSGVKPTTEMVELISASRMVEANAKMMQTQDQMLSGLFNRVLRTK